MTIFNGVMSNGVVTFAAPVPIPEGAAVCVTIQPMEHEIALQIPTILERWKSIIGKGDGLLPPDASSKIDYYLTHGLPE